MNSAVSLSKQEEVDTTTNEGSPDKWIIEVELARAYKQNRVVTLEYCESHSNILLSIVNDRGVNVSYLGSGSPHPASHLFGSIVAPPCPTSLPHPSQNPSPSPFAPGPVSSSSNISLLIRAAAAPLRNSLGR